MSPTRLLQPAAEATFLAYLHYLEDLAGLVGGHYGVAGSLVEGVYDGVSGHLALTGVTPRTVGPAETAALSSALGAAWAHLAAVAADGPPERNAVLPERAHAAVVAVARALALACGQAAPAHEDEALEDLDACVTEGALPYPWSAACAGCPQIGTTIWAGTALPGDVSVFAAPDPATSDARLALLLRTTRARRLEQRFAEARRTDVRPGRTRRNLSREAKELLAAQTPPTTLFDVFWRLHERAARDDGEAFVLGALDDDEARRFAVALTLVTDASLAAVEAVIAETVGWDLFADLAAGAARRLRTPALERRARAVQRRTASR
jgi:hypothetical protein